MMLVLLLLFLSVQLICFWHAAYVTFQTYPVPCRHDGIYCTTCALQLFDSRGFYSTIMFFTLTCNLILVEFKCTCSSLILGLFNQKKKKKRLLSRGYVAWLGMDITPALAGYDSVPRLAPGGGRQRMGLGGHQTSTDILTCSLFQKNCTKVHSIKKLLRVKQRHMNMISLKKKNVLLITNLINLYIYIKFRILHTIILAVEIWRPKQRLLVHIELLRFSILMNCFIIYS